MKNSLQDMSMVELFRMEAESQLGVLTQGLLSLERGDKAALEAMMRAAHSLKGAGRIVGINAAVSVAHVMEDVFVAAQRDQVSLGGTQVDLLLQGVDLLTRIAQSTDIDLPAWEGERAGLVDTVVGDLKSILPPAEEGSSPHPFGPPRKPAARPASTPPPAPPAPTEPAPSPSTGETPPAPAASPAAEATPAAPAGAPRATAATAAPPRAPGETGRVERADARTLRVTAENLNRLLGLAGESLVESRWLRPYGVSVARLKRLHHELAGTIEQLRDRISSGDSQERLKESLLEAQRRLALCREHLGRRLDELDTYDRRSTNLAQRLYGEAVAVRMRPFSDGVTGFPRMVRDVARSLGKEVRLEILGEETKVDRDVLEKLEAPLGHLLRNASDHGIEAPGVRLAAGKPALGTITLEARHQAGVLLVTVNDDGRGADPELIRAAVVRKKLVAAETAPRLSDAELLEFLFLPGFTMKETVTEISGRGVGLDVVQSMVKAVRGSVRVASSPGRGMRFQLQLPLTLSVVRALLVEVAGEPYAIPLGFITRTLRLPEKDIASTEGRQHFAFDGRRVGLVTAHQVLGRPGAPRGNAVPVVVLGEPDRRYGVVVDGFIGERELVVQPLDPRLGKVKDIAAGSLMEDGSPVLIIDVDDMVRSVEKAAASGALGAIQTASAASGADRKRVLVVDDSLTVRELERKLLETRGYAVEMAVDGMDGWNAVRIGSFDLVISDVDMPRLDGIELTKLIKQDPKLRGLPVMIVSYKDREEDRRRGLEAGADYYLTKGSFHDDTMLNAVRDLIGHAQEDRS
ncbi:MAG: hybrid sensor histidine kinase/response regulator [Verrucomicrobia bacterium]|nr:hybrid sensor histidine kinase/response regulator [Verrucomicrobiota bacterium]